MALIAWAVAAWSSMPAAVAMVSVFVPLMVTLALPGTKLRLFTVKSVSSVVVRFVPPVAVKYTSLMLPGSESTPLLPAASVVQFALFDHARSRPPTSRRWRACRAG